MSKLARIRTTNRNMNGVSALPMPPGMMNEHGEFDLRPARFKFFSGTYKRVLDGARYMLTELVNLPEVTNDQSRNESTVEVDTFIQKYHNLALGRTTGGGHPAPAMTREEIMHFRSLYRAFWTERSDSWKSRRFLELISKWPEAMNWQPLPEGIRRLQSGVIEGTEEQLSALIPYPYADYCRYSGLKMDWKTFRFEIVARGPIDWLTDAVFRNRNRLRICSRPACRKLFIADFPKQDLCRFPGSECRRQSELERKNKWWKKNRGTPHD